MEAGQIDALIAYLEANPLVAVVLTVLVVLVLGSIIKKLLKVAFILAVIFLAGLYWTNRQASSDEWKVHLDALKKKGAKLLESGAEKAAEKAVEEGKKAIEKGKEEVEKQLSESK